MPVVDFFVHPVAAADEKALFDLQSLDLDRTFADLVDRNRRNGVAHALVHLFDRKILARPHQFDAVRRQIAARQLSFSCLVDPSDPAALQQIAAAAAAGVKGITLHPYLQRLDDSAHDAVARVADTAGRAGLFVGVCCAYGSTAIFDIHPLRIALRAAEASKGPVVILHGGGAKVIDAILIADACPNVLLETSFSLPYWLGSSVEQDFAAALWKLTANRCLFGSDAPFCDQAEALAQHQAFLARHGFTAQDSAAFLGAAAARLLGI